MHFLMLILLANLHWLYIVREYLAWQRRRRIGVRRWWVKPFIQENQRNIFGAYESAFRYFEETDYEEFYDMVRMTPDDFEELFRLVGLHLQKVSRRRPLSPRLRLALTLNFIAHGDSVSTTRKYFRVGRSTTFSIVSEVCSVIWNMLSPLLLRERNEADNRIIAGGFRARWHLGNCVGAMDGKEFEIMAPPKSGSLFFNYKKFFSFKILAVCDAYYRFTWVYVGDYGSVSDLSTFRNTGLYDNLERGEGHLPPSCHLPRSNTLMPFYYIGDEIFTLKSYMMVPYARHRGLDEKQANYNYRLSKARNCIEDSFGILCSRWQILNKPMCFKLETSIEIAKATLCLHNFILTRKLERRENIDDEITQEVIDARNVDSESDDEDFEPPYAQDVHDVIPLNVLEQRNLLADYLNSDLGSIPE